MVVVSGVQTRLEDFANAVRRKDGREAISRIRARHVDQMSKTFAAGLLAALEKAEGGGRK
ncbi:MAG: hypothetical protein QXO04_01505 [Nitrososphaerota archaeon]